MTDSSIEAFIKGVEALLLHIPAPLRAAMAMSILILAMWALIMFARFKWGKRPDAEVILMQDRYERLEKLLEKEQARVDQLIAQNDQFRDRATKLEEERNEARREVSNLKWDKANLEKELYSERKANQILGGNDATH